MNENSMQGKCEFQEHASKGQCLANEAVQLRAARIRIADLEEALMLMVYQYCTTEESLEHRYMCAGEHAFAVLGLKNGDSVEKLEAMMDSAQKNREKLYLLSPPNVKMDLAGLSRYARDKGVSVRDLTEEEMNQFGVFTQQL